MAITRAKTLEEKLVDKIVRRDIGCWDWAGALDVGGYGKIRPESANVVCEYGYEHTIRQSQQQAHRVVYELLVGPIPQGLFLDHLCSNRACVRPDHLEPVTAQENARRAHAGQTHCVNNHELTEENSYSYKGRRACKICRTAAARRFKEKNPERMREIDRAYKDRQKAKGA